MQGGQEGRAGAAVDGWQPAPLCSRRAASAAARVRGKHARQPTGPSSPHLGGDLRAGGAEARGGRAAEAQARLRPGQAVRRAKGHRVQRRGVAHQAALDGRGAVAQEDGLAGAHPAAGVDGWGACEQGGWVGGWSACEQGGWVGGWVGCVRQAPRQAELCTAHTASTAALAASRRDQPRRTHSLRPWDTGSMPSSTRRSAACQALRRRARAGSGRST